MASFATVDDLGNYLQKTFATGAETDQAQLALDMATADIREWTRQWLELVEDDEITLWGTSERELILPERPVVAVTAVDLDGMALQPPVWRISGSRLVRDAGWRDVFATVTVTYTHGFDPLPEAIRMATIRLAAKATENPSGVRQEGIGSYSVTYGGDSAGGSAEAILASLGRYRERTASPSMASAQQLRGVPVANGPEP